VTESAAQDQELALPPAQIEELMQLLVKAQRAQQLYLPNNPIYQNAIAKLRDAFKSVWEATDDLILDVREADLVWEGHVVYTVSSRSESIAWVMYKDGVRSMTFLPGVEEEEIVGLLDVIQRARTLQAEDNDDLLTLLWEKDFHRIQYVFQDLTSDANIRELPSAADIVPPQTSAIVIQQAVEEEAPPRPEGIVKTEDFDTTLYFLDEQEIEYLRAAVQEEYTQDLRRNVLAMLFDIMELQPFPTVRVELITILENFLPYLLGAADFGAVAYVLREARNVIARARELLPEHKEALERLPTRLSQEQTLAQLLQALDEATVHPDPAELAELFNELRPESLPTLFAWLGKLTNERVRDIVEQSVQRLAVSNADKVVEALTSTDTAVVAAAVRVAGRLKLAPAVAGLGQAFGNPDPVVRAAVVQALADIASPAALQSLERGLDDADREVRLASVKVIATHRSKSALPKITEVVQGKSVRQRDLTEKMSFFEAYGMMIGDAGVESLDAVLNSGGFLKRKEDPQTRACAAMALGKIGTPAAQESLRRATADKEPLVKNAAMRALRGERASALFKPGDDR